MTGKYHSEPVPKWLSSTGDGLGCEHRWDEKRPVPGNELPRYAKGVEDTYCSECGVKQTFKDKIQAQIGTSGS